MIAIHDRPGSFSDKWIDYCKENAINYKIVNCYDSDIIEQVNDCEGLMWHWPHWDVKAQLFARQLTYALEKKKIKVFPDSKTCWHYDDKVGQKYLFEAINAPLVPTYVFYEKEEALKWASSTKFPKVFKTRNGAGSQNVKLIKNKHQAFSIIKKSFKKGIPTYEKVAAFKDSIWKLNRDKTLKSLGRVVKYSIKLLLPRQYQPEYSYEKNYVYFQDFIPECDCDYRIKIVGDKCWGFKRFVRNGDFRASGSGKSDFNPNSIPERLVILSFDISRKLKLQTVAFDFVEYDGDYFLIEMSYASSMIKGQTEQGYWYNNLNWHSGKFIPEYFMIEDFLNEINSSTVN